MTAKNTQLKLYKIDKTILLTDTTDEIIEEIIKIANKGFVSPRKFEIQSLSKDLQVPEGHTK